MIKGIFRKVTIALGFLTVVGGVAFAAFTITQNVSVGNTVQAAGVSLQITSTPINLNGLTVGGSTTPNVLTIKNTGAYTGNVKLNITGVTGSLCSDLTFTVGGDATGSLNPIANGSIDLGNLAPGATLNLTQVVSLSASSTKFGQSCGWSETATLSN